MVFSCCHSFQILCHLVESNFQIPFYQIEFFRLRDLLQPTVFLRCWFPRLQLFRNAVHSGISLENFLLWPLLPPMPCLPCPSIAGPSLDQGGEDNSLSDQDVVDLVRAGVPVDFFLTPEGGRFPREIVKSRVLQWTANQISGGEPREHPTESSPANPLIRERGTPPSDESEIDCKRFHRESGLGDTQIFVEGDIQMMVDDPSQNAVMAGEVFSAPPCLLCRDRCCPFCFRRRWLTCPPISTLGGNSG